jgi:uncharacterized membrane protein
MEWLLVVAGIAAVVILFSRQADLKNKVTALEAQVQRLGGRLADLETVEPEPSRPKPRAKAQAAPAAAAAPPAVREDGPVEIPASIVPPDAAVAAPPPVPTPPPAESKPAWPTLAQRNAARAERSAGTAAPAAPARPSAPPLKQPDRPIDWERTLGVRLPVWGGAIMLLIAGFFLVNWALESGAYLFTPTVRTVLCGLAAVALIVAAFVVKSRRIANGDRIAGALAAAGLAVAYGTMFLATGVFHLVPDGLALVVAVLVTLAAIWIATRFDQRIMLVGLLGGYLTPLFAWSPSGVSEVMPFYIAVLLAASAFAIRWNGWWGQAIPALMLPALWAAALAFSSVDAPTLAGLDVLLALLPAAAALLPLRADGGASGHKVWFITTGAIASALCLGLGIWVREFSDPWLLVAVALLGLGGAALLVRQGPGLRPAWLATLALALFAHVAWRSPDGPTFLVFALVLAAIHLGALAWQFRGGVNRGARAFEISALSALLFVILIVQLDGWLGARDVPYAWAAVAVVIAALFGWLAVRAHKPEAANGPSAGFAAGASAFLSLALGLVLDPVLYALVAALQAAGLALLYLKFRAPVLRQMHVAYLALYGVLLFVGQGVSGGYATIGWQDSLGGMAGFVPKVGINDAPVTLLLLPGLALLVAATALARLAYDGLPRFLDVVSVILVALAIHFVILPAWPYALFDTPLVTGSWWFNVLLLVAVAAVFAAGRTGRFMLLRAGLGLAVVVSVALAVTVILPVFRFWPEMQTPGPPVFNAALSGIGLPALLLLAIAYLARQGGLPQLARGLAAYGGLVGMVTLLVVIRQAIHGPTLQGPGAVPGQIELYLYSAGMLLYGFALLWGGVAFSSLALRAGSLLVVLATIGKVFLYDISGLEGLWRVGSFLGLGIALLVVSWLYGRFVFGLGPSGKRAKEETAG